MSIYTINQKIFHAFPALSHRNFRLFWGGQCISLIGTWMQSIGQSWLVLELTHSAFKLGIVTAMQFLPMMIFSIFAGTFVDRFSKRKILLITQTSMMILAGILAVLTGFKAVQYWHVLLLALLSGFVNAIDIPTRQTYFIELVGKEDLMNAIALNSTVFNLARIIGPALAGIVIGLFGITACFYINAISFIAVLIGIWRIDILLSPIHISKSKINLKCILQDVKEGLIYISERPIICFPLVLLGVISTFVMNFNILVPIYAQENLLQGSEGYGFLMTFLGIGSFLGALMLVAKSRGGPKVWILLSGAFGMSLFTIIMGLGNVYILACILLAIIGVCLIVFTASVNSIIQLNSEDNMRGRVMSVYTLVLWGFTPIGSLFVGRIAESVGAPLCLIICGVIGVVATIIISRLLLTNKGVAYQQEA